MSRIGKRPVAIPSGVTAQIENGMLTVKGPKGTLAMGTDDLVSYKLEDGSISVQPANDSQASRAHWGMQRTLVNNMVVGVTQGFEQSLELVGVGYRAAMKGQALSMQLGFSHDVDIKPPAGIAFATPKQTEIKISGIDKQVVGEIAARIRRIRPPEPYKGKGVRYAGEKVRRKEGKKK